MIVCIRNWRRYQHYKNRRPPWIKFYVDLLGDDEIKELPPGSRLVACLLLLVAANRENRIPADPHWLAAELALPLNVCRRALADLTLIGFLVPASPDASNGASPDASGTDSVSCVPARSRQRQRTEAEDREPSLSSEEPPTVTVPETTARDGYGDGRGFQTLEANSELQRLREA